MVKLYLLKTDVLNDDAVFAEQFAEMSACRQQKITDYIFRKDKNLSLGVGILLKRGLAEAGVDGAEIVIGQNGKPYLKNHADVFFNLSHSGAYAAAAFSEKEVGCDIEQPAPLEDAFVRSVCSPAEYEQIQACDHAAGRREAFYRWWTLRESYLKQTGRGLLDDARSIEIRMSASVTVLSGGVVQDVCFREYAVEDYRIAVCGAERQFVREPISVFL